MSSQPRTPAPEQAPLQAPGLVDLIEGSLRAAFQPGTVFSAYAALPQPSFGVMAACMGFWIAVGGLLNAVMVQMHLPLTSGGGPLPLVLGLAGFILLVFALSFPAAGLAHLLAKASGGSGPYGRSYQVLSMIGILIPASFGLLWSGVPYLGLLSTLYGSFLLARGISLLHGTPGAQAGMVVGAVGLALAVGQALAQQSITRLQRDMETLANLYTASQGMSPAPPAAPRGSDSEPLSGGRADAGASSQGAQAQSPSGIDMIRGSDPGAPAGAVGAAPMLRPQEQERMLEDGRRMQEAGFSMIDRVSKQMDGNPALTQNMDPAQREQMKQMLGAVNQMRGQLKQGGEKPDASKMVRQLMQVISNIQPPAAEETPKKKGKTKKRKLKAPAEEAE